MIPPAFSPDIKQSLLNALPQDSSVSKDAPALAYSYFPETHARALHIDTALVEGIRGAGKSFWYKTLQDTDRRRAMAKAYPHIGIGEATLVGQGFGGQEIPDEYPSSDILVDLLRQDMKPRNIWRTIILRHIGRHEPVDMPLDSWVKSARWLTDNPEPVARAFADADATLNRRGQKILLVFDALDKTAESWEDLGFLLKGLLQVLLEFKGKQAIRLKAFVRPDHLDYPGATGFVDSSKLLTQKVELRWPATELYGLLWQHLANEPHYGNQFREYCSRYFPISWETFSGIWSVPQRMRTDEQLQRDILHAITGPFMGKDRRRGYPYSWLISHLGDGSRQVSPRSFLAAIVRAAEGAGRAPYPYPLHYDDIKEGVKEASRLRVRELKEDYAWVEKVMAPLAGLNVPCDPGIIIDKWHQSNILNNMKNPPNQIAKNRPVHIEEGLVGLMEDLIALHIFEYTQGTRINIPDVYRVGYGLGRKGGIKPVARN